jgi:hypothetical protein
LKETDVTQTSPQPGSPAPAGLADHADLERLAVELAQRGYPATLLTLRPVLAVSHLGSVPPPRILVVGSCYYWATAEPIGTRADPDRAADIIAWALHAGPRS